MLLAWNVCKHVKSNAIVIANEEKTLGVGSGQMNRVDSLRIAAMRAERFGLPILRLRTGVGRVLSVPRQRR